MQQGRFQRPQNHGPMRIRGLHPNMQGPRGPQQVPHAFRQRGPQQEFQAPRGPPRGMNPNIPHGGPQQFQGNMGPPRGAQPRFPNEMIRQRGPLMGPPGSSMPSQIPQHQPLMQSKFSSYTGSGIGNTKLVRANWRNQTNCSTHALYDNKNNI